MVPQKQRWHRGPVFDEAGEQTDEGGDCLAACLASILEVPIEGFPNFLAPGDYGEAGWWHRWNLWLYEHYRAELLYWPTIGEIPDPETQLVWWAAGVMSPDGIRHSVVFYRDQFRWDPSPAAGARKWALADVHDGIGLFSVSSIFGRPDGPYVPGPFLDEEQAIGER